jgi:transposase
MYMRYLSLTSDQFDELDAALHDAPCHGQYFKRIQSVKLNGQQYSLPAISQILDVHYNTVYRWIRRYEAEGIDGLLDQPKSGRPSLLSEEDRPSIEAWVEEMPNQPKTILARIEQELDKTISRSTLKRTLKQWGYSYHRARTSLHSKRDKTAFAEKKKNSKSSKA